MVDLPRAAASGADEALGRADPEAAASGLPCKFVRLLAA